MYTLYTNEIPLLHNIMNNAMYKKLTGYKCNNYTNVEHTTINFVDDTPSMMSFKDTINVRNYVTDFYNLLESFYTINHLFINAEKMHLILTHKPKYKIMLKNFSFQANKYKIIPKKFIKILGFYIRSDLKLTSQVGKVSSELHNRLHELSRVSQYLDFSTRLSFVNAYILGKIQYAMPLYYGLNNELENKFHKILMRSARLVIGNYCPKKTIGYILDKCDILPIKTFILFATIKLFHNIAKNNSPESIINIYKKKHIRDKIIKFRPKYIPKAVLLEKTCIYEGAEKFNMLPSDLKDLSSKEKFAKQIKNIP